MTTTKISIRDSRSGAKLAFCLCCRRRVAAAIDDEDDVSGPQLLHACHTGIRSRGRLPRDGYIVASMSFRNNANYCDSIPNTLKIPALYSISFAHLFFHLLFTRLVLQILMLIGAIFPCAIFFYLFAFFFYT